VNVRDIIPVVDFVISSFASHNLEDGYQKLIAAIRGIATQVNPPPPVVAQVNSLRDNLLALHRKILPPETWSDDQRQMYVDLRADELLGPPAAEAVSRIFESNFHSGNNVIGSLETKRGTIQALIERFVWLRSGLERFRAKSQEPADEIRIRFRGRASIRTLPQLEKAADDWQKILKGLLQLLDPTPPDPIIVGADKSSPFELVILLKAAGGVALVLNCYKATLDIQIARLTREKMRRELGIKNVEDVPDLQAREDEQKLIEEKALATRAAKLIETHNPTDGQMGNITTDALKRLLENTENGVQMSPGQGIATELKQLRNQITSLHEDIKRLSRPVEMKQIGDSTVPPDPPIPEIEDPDED
jgi:hypothetical protein